MYLPTIAIVTWTPNATGEGTGNQGRLMRREGCVPRTHKGSCVLPAIAIVTWTHRGNQRRVHSGGA